MPHRRCLLLAGIVLSALLACACRTPALPHAPDLPDPGEHSPRRTQ